MPLYGSELYAGNLPIAALIMSFRPRLRKEREVEEDYADEEAVERS